MSGEPDSQQEEYRVFCGNLPFDCVLSDIETVATAVKGRCMSLEARTMAEEGDTILRQFDMVVTATLRRHVGKYDEIVVFLRSESIVHFLNQ